MLMKKADGKLTACGRFQRLECAVYLILLYGIHAFVYLNGDDFVYATFKPNDFLEKLWYCYYTANGRFWVNFLEVVLLWCDRYLFIALNPLLITVFVWLLAKNVQVLTGREDKTDIMRQVLVGGVLFACVDVMCLRETVFWFSGVMNYLLPATMLLLGVLLFSYASAGRIKGWQWAPYCAVCLLAGSSVEQYALMFFGFMTIMLAIDLLKKKKHKYPLYLGYGCAFLGLLALFLSPANFARAGMFEFKDIFRHDVITLFRGNTFENVSFPLVLMLSLCGVAFEHKADSLKKKPFRVLLLLVPVVFLAVSAVPALNKNKLWAAAAAVYFIQLFRLFVLRKYAYKAELLALGFVGFGSQIMLLVSLIWGWRCMFSMFVVDMLLIACCLSELDKKTRLFILCSGITVSIHPLLTAAYWGAVAILRLIKKESAGVRFSGAALRLSVLAALLVLLFGYAGNAATHRQNLESTKSPENGVVTIKVLPDETYSWYFVPFSKGYEVYYRILYNLPDDVGIVFEAASE